MLSKKVLSRLIGRAWTDHDGQDRVLTDQDFIVQAPFNEQVALMRRDLSTNPLVTTVHKAQGREAAVSITSLAKADRMSIDRNLLNTAISRARTISYVVVNPDLVTVRVNSVEQMRQISGLLGLMQTSPTFDANLDPTEFRPELPSNLPPTVAPPHQSAPEQQHGPGLQELALF